MFFVIKCLISNAYPHDAKLPENVCLMLSLLVLVSKSLGSILSWHSLQALFDLWPTTSSEITEQRTL